MKSALKLPPRFWIRAGLFCFGMTMLIAIYIFQRTDVAGRLGNFHPNVIFSVNRILRLIVNDLACFFLILALFREKKYLKIAFFVFLLELLIILPVYLVVKLSLEGPSEISSPLLSQVHRLIVNPVLMLLLIAGFVYQRYAKSQQAV